MCVNVELQYWELELELESNCNLLLPNSDLSLPNCIVPNHPDLGGILPIFQLKSHSRPTESSNNDLSQFHQIASSANSFLPIQH